MRKASQSANPNEHFMLLEGETLEAWSSGHRYRWVPRWIFICG